MEAPTSLTIGYSWLLELRQPPLYQIQQRPIAMLFAAYFALRLSR
jgi:hypothetical protein